MDVASILARAIQAAGTSLDGDELAWLALTGKVELHLRDRIGMVLNASYGEVLAAREWKRTDLAVLSRSCDPIAMVESKALYTFDCVSDTGLARYSDFLGSDATKMRTLGDAERFLLVFVTNVMDEVSPDLASVVKCRPGINRGLRLHGADLARVAAEQLEEMLSSHGRVVARAELGEGVAFGVRAEVKSWLLRSSWLHRRRAVPTHGSQPTAQTKPVGRSWRAARGR